MKHFNVDLNEPQDIEDADNAMDLLLQAAQMIIELSEKAGAVQPAQTTMMIPLELPDGISVLISRDAAEVRH